MGEECRKNAHVVCRGGSPESSARATRPDLSWVVVYVSLTGRASGPSPRTVRDRHGFAESPGRSVGPVPTPARETTHTARPVFRKGAKGAAQRGCTWGGWPPRRYPPKTRASGSGGYSVGERGPEPDRLHYDPMGERLGTLRFRAREHRREGSRGPLRFELPSLKGLGGRSQHLHRLATGLDVVDHEYESPGARCVHPYTPGNKCLDRNHQTFVWGNGGGAWA